jgi:hypothetical protein
VSFDDGDHWQSLQLNLPVVPITDLAIHKRDKDLIAATQGRSFWVLDDLPALHQMTDAAKADAYLFKPEDVYRMPGGGFQLPSAAAVGQNPPAGALIYYYLKEKPKVDVTLEVMDAAGHSIKKYTARAPKAEAGPPNPTPPTMEQQEEGPPGPRAVRLPADAGLNRFVWDLRYEDAKRFPGLIMWAGDTRGPRAVPGGYQVKLTIGDKTYTESFAVTKDPRLDTTAEDFQKQFDLLVKIRDKFNDMTDAITRIRDARKQIDDITARVKDQPNSKAIQDAARSLKVKMTAVEEALYQTKNQSGQDPLNYPIRLNNRLAALSGVVSGADAAPTAQSYAVYEELVADINAQLATLNQVISTDLPAFNKLVRDQDIPAVMVKQKAGGR